MAGSAILDGPPGVVTMNRVGSHILISESRIVNVDYGDNGVLGMRNCLAERRILCQFALLSCLLIEVSGCGSSSSSPVTPVASVISWTAPASIVYGTALSATQLNATANDAGTFVYTPALGTVLTAGEQALSVTFTPTDATHYSSATKSVALTVNPATPVISWTAPGPISFGSALTATQLDATATIPGSFVYSPAIGAVLDAGSQSLSVTFTPTDATNYATATAGVSLTVNAATPVLTWATPAAVKFGTTLGSTQLDAVAYAPGSNAPLAGTYLYSPSSGTMVNLIGNETLKVTFTPSDAADYTQAQGSVTLSVTAAGIVSWGDSLTQGMQGIEDVGNYPTDLGALLTVPVVNQGINGQNTTQIGVRQGGIPTSATVSGGTIPASGGVMVTFVAGYEPSSLSGVVSGTILGVHGEVTYPAYKYTFTRTTAGDAVSAPGPTPFVVDTPYADYIPIFWEGRNNYREHTVPSILPDIAAQVAAVPSGVPFYVISNTNNNIQTDWLGGAEYSQIMAINQQLQSTYGSHYVDVRNLLVSKYDPTLITDVSDHQHDEIPTSLRAISGTGTLVSAISSTDTTFDVNLTSGELQALFILTIGSGAEAENVSVVSFSGTTVTVIRNFGGNNTAHAAGTAFVETDKTHLTAQGYQIVAEQLEALFTQYAK
jgi:hypothetical protein